MKLNPTINNNNVHFFFSNGVHPFTKKVLFAFIILTASINLTGQSKDGTIKAPQEFQFPYIKITQVEITGRHKTKDRIIIRELDFNIGDSLYTRSKRKTHLIQTGEKRFLPSDSCELLQRLKYSRENIINTKLFLIVDFYLEKIKDDTYKLTINVQERWYFWVFPIVKLDYPNLNDWLLDPDYDLINTGLFLSHNNLWGLSHQGSIIGSWGSSQSAGVGYYIPWIGKGKKIGLRIGSIYRNSAVIEYAAKNNNRQMLYAKGSILEVLASSTLTIRPKLYDYATLKINSYYTEISDTLSELTNNFLPKNKSRIFSIDLYIDYYYDSRNNTAYPLKGNYLKTYIEKKGLGIISHDVDYFFYGIDFHFYQKLSEKFYTAEMFKLSKSSSQNIPYYFKQTLNSDADFIRGYDYYALRGDEKYFFRGNFKYELIKPGIRKARKEKYKESKFRNLPYAFYLNALTDAAYLVDEFDSENNTYLNKILYSWGIGLDFITYYDLVLRFEYIFTNTNTHGFYIGFGMPI